MTTKAACPFCNAPLPPLTLATDQDRLPCPRCGEPVPVNRWAIEPPAAGLKPGEPPMGGIRTEVEIGTPSKRQNRKTASIVLGIMLGMAAIAFGYALWTADLRRSRHPRMPKRTELLTHRRPLELDGLGHLPQGCVLVAGIHGAEAMSDKKVGRQIFEEPRPAVFDWFLKQIPRATGMDMDEVDHVVLAATLEPAPRVLMVVKTRTPYELERVARAARPAAKPLFQDRPLYELSLVPIGEAFLWCVEERTLVFVIPFTDLKLDQLSGVSPTADKRADTLPPALQTVLKERLPGVQYLWIAAEMEKLDALKMLLPPNRGAMKDMKMFALGVAPIEGMTLTAHFQLRDAKGAAHFAKSLEGIPLEGAKSQKIEATPADAPESWVTWQVRGEIEAIRAVLDRGRSKK